MGRLAQDERGQSLLGAALFMAFIGVLLLAAIGVAAAYSHVAQAQAAADAAALAGARAARVREVKIGPHTICRLAEIDPDEAVAEAQAYWQSNISGTSLVTEMLQIEVMPPTKPTRLSVSARVKAPTGPLGVIGSPHISLPVRAEASLEPGCENSLPGPVFAQNRPLPAGWPVPGAEWVWNFPGAERNAPTNWPVYFVRVFDLPQPSEVTVYVAADGDYEAGVDDQLLIAGSGEAVRSITVPLNNGSHAFWIRVVNPQPQGSAPFTGPNPAGVLIGAVDSINQVVFVSKGNAVTNASRPNSLEDWGSWSPAHPDWSVYVDPFYPTVLASGSSKLAEYLEAMGFSLRDASAVAAWMQAAIASKRAPRTILVMAQDAVPDTIASSPNSSSLIRQYLDAGGTVLWVGETPFYYQGRSDGSTVRWGESAQTAIAGVPGSTAYWRPLPGEPVQILPEAARVGIDAEWWLAPNSTRATTPDCWLEPLAQTASGGISAWRRSYWPLSQDCANPSYVSKARSENTPGLVRIYDAPIDLSVPEHLVSIGAMLGQIAGWYRAPKFVGTP